MREGYNERQVLAWHTAALQRTKRLPRLNTLLLPEAPIRKRRQTMQEQLAVMDRLATIMQRIHSPMQRMAPNARDGET